MSLYEKVRLKLLYRGTEDGFNYKSFISKATSCNEKKTISICKSKVYNKVFGGYSKGGFKKNINRDNRDNNDDHKNNNNNNNNVDDNDGFIYSLTHNKKFN